MLGYAQRRAGRAPRNGGGKAQVVPLWGSGTRARDGAAVGREARCKLPPSCGAQGARPIAPHGGRGLTLGVRYWASLVVTWQAH